MAQGGCRSILRAELGRFWGQKPSTPAGQPPPEMQPSGTTPRHLWFMAHDLCLLSRLLMLPLLGGGMGGGAPGALLHRAPSGGKGPLPWEGALAPACAQQWVAWLLDALHGWLGGCSVCTGALGRDCRRRQCESRSSEPSTFPVLSGFFNVLHLSLKGLFLFLHHKIAMEQ